MTCEIYPDLYLPPPNKDTVSADKLAEAYNANMRRARLLDAVAYQLRTSFKLDWDVAETFLKSNRFQVPAPDDQQEARIFLMAVTGLLLADNKGDPSLGTQPLWAVIRTADPAKQQITISDPPPVSDPAPGATVIERKFMLLDEATLDGQERLQRIVLVRRFGEAVVDAVKEFQDDEDLFTRVFQRLRDEGADGANSTIYLRQVAEVTRRLVQRGIGPDDPQLNHYIDDALSISLGGGLVSDPVSTDVDIIDLDLDAGETADVVGPNVFALAGIYYAAMLEDMKFFATADKVAEQFTSGLLPITRGTGGGRIYRYHREAVNRMTEGERRSLYARSFGLAQGSVDEPMPNREFQDLWLRFLSTLSLFNRQTAYERTLVTGQQLFKGARDLAVNLSLHGYGLAHFAAVELQQLVRDVHAMLSDQEVVAAYGTRDVWQLVDRVSQMYLGGSVNGVRNRTLAQSGGRIIKWLGDHSAMLSSTYTRGVDEEFRRGSLLDDAERWLAVNGVKDATVTQFAEPVAAAAQPTIPALTFGNMQMPSVNDALNAASAIAGAPALAQPALAG